MSLVSTTKNGKNMKRVFNVYVNGELDTIVEVSTDLLFEHCVLNIVTPFTCNRALFMRKHLLKQQKI